MSSSACEGSCTLDASRHRAEVRSEGCDEMHVTRPPAAGTDSLNASVGGSWVGGGCVSDRSKLDTLGRAGCGEVS
jgi:hypothetical protein